MKARTLTLTRLVARLVPVCVTLMDSPLLQWSAMSDSVCGAHVSEN